ncbi:MAG: biotin--[acetyl-CoA-carboxylase] ligase [Microbacterium sp.]
MTMTESEVLPRAAAVSSRLEFLAQAESTNTEMRVRARDCTEWPHLSVIVTDDQTAGRGRLDRSWVAPPGQALAISVLVRELPPVDARGWIPLAAGVAMADAVADQLPDHEVALKWPNDVLVDGRKICGILAEVTEDAVIVGAGVNTAMPASALPVATAISFAAVGVTADADRLLWTYLLRLDSLLSALAVSGDAISSGLHRAASDRCATIGSTVRVLLPGERSLEGTATVLDAHGRLVVSSVGVEHPVSAGDVVHVRPAAV